MKDSITSTITSERKIEISADELEAILKDHFKLSKTARIDWDYGQLFRGVSISDKTTKTQAK